MREGGTRITWLMACLAIGLVVLGAQLYRLTVVQAPAWRIQAQDQMLRELPSYGPRGAIFDRKGRALATSEPAFAAVLVHHDLRDVEPFLPQLTLAITDGDATRARELESRVRRRIREMESLLLRFEPLVVGRNLTPAAVATLAERRHDFPGLVVVTESLRDYPMGKLAGAVVGYVGRIGDEIQSPEFKGYQVDEVVGKTGLELTYEKELRGKPGRRQVLVDPFGRLVSNHNEELPEPGNSLVLSIDADLQRAAEEILARQIDWIRKSGDPAAKPVRGALVVQDVRTGAIRAMVSSPTYDPNHLVKGTPQQWEELQKQPGAMMNWAIEGFPPGSTHKMAVGLAGISAGVIRPTDWINCPAEYWRYDFPKNWTGYDQGPADLSRALAISCNPYFFETGHLMGIDRMAAFMEQFGFGKQTGIDLPHESRGQNPNRASYGDRWQPGHAISVAIGQGDVLTTPLQLAGYTATVANSGVRYRPYLVEEVQGPDGKPLRRTAPQVLNQIKLPAEAWQATQYGMRKGVSTAEGTAHSGFLGFPIPVAAKTGTAQTGKPWDNGLTVAYAPYDKPEIAVSVVVEGGARGSWTSAVVRRVMAHYFGVQDVIPEGVPTYR